MLKKQIAVALTERQRILLGAEADRLTSNVPELIRRIIDAWLDAAERKEAGG